MAEAMQTHKFKLKKEDSVEVIAGKDKGKRGRVLKILREKGRLVVEGINIVKKAKKRKNQRDRGGIIEVESTIHYSNVAIVCKKCGPTRIGYNIEGANEPSVRGSKKTKTRICRKCKEAF